jgi:hypothetical protein
LHSTAKYRQKCARDCRDISAAKEAALHPMGKRLFGIHFHMGSFTPPMAMDLRINGKMLRNS